MKPKTLLIAVLALAALCAAAWFFNRPVPPPAARDPRLNQPLLAPAAAENAARLTLTDKGATIVLARPSASTGWQVATNHDLPVDFPKLAALVQTLTTTRIERLVTSSPDRLARLGFSDTTLTASDAAGQPLLVLTLGKDAEGGGRYLRFANESKAYLARLDTTLDTDPSNWTDSTLLRFLPADIARITFAFPSPLTVSRASATAPFTTDADPAGQRLKADILTSLLSTLSSLRFTKTSESTDPQATGARAAAHSVTLTTFDGKTITVALGRSPERTIPSAYATHSAPAGFFLHDTSPAPVALLGPLTEKIPPGPAFAFVSHSDPAAPINALMQKRAFQVSDFALTALPPTAASLFEPIPIAPSSAPAKTP